MFHVAVDGNDANDGTGKTPFRTVTRALRVAPGGSFIWIRRGTYEEPITSADIRRPGGKSWDLPTVVMGLPDINRANGNGRQVTFAPKGAPAAIHLDSPEVGYLHFENLIIDGSGLQEDAGVGVWTQAVRDVHFVDLEIKNAPSYGASLESTGHGIELWRCQIHHNFGDQVFIAAGDSGVYFSEVSNSPLAAIVVTEKPGRGVNVTIEGNRIHEAGLRSLYPVYVNHALSTRIVNNVIYKADGGIAVLGNAVDTTVFHNTIVDSFGISVAQSLNTRVNNNLLVRAGITMSSMANIDMRNNLTTRTPGFFDEFELQYWLTSASPAIDFGMSLPEVPFDVLGTPRPQGALPDVGAYEFVSPTR